MERGNSQPQDPHSSSNTPCHHHLLKIEQGNFVRRGIVSFYSSIPHPSLSDTADLSSSQLLCSSTPPPPFPNRLCFQGFFAHYGGVSLSSHSPSLLFPIGLLSLGFLWEIFLYLSQLALVLVWNRFPWRRFGEEIQLLFPSDPSTRKSVSEFSITGVSWCLIAPLAEETESIALLLFCYDSGSRARNLPDCVPAV